MVLVVEALLIVAVPVVTVFAKDAAVADKLVVDAVVIVAVPRNAFVAVKPEADN